MLTCSFDHNDNEKVMLDLKQQLIDLFHSLQNCMSLTLVDIP